MTEHQLKAWQTGGGAVMHATVIPFQRTQTNSPDYVTSAIEKDWPSVISDTASDCREDITRIRRAKALLAIIEQWGDTAFDDITSEIERGVIDPAEDALREALRSTAFCASDDDCEHEIEDRVHETSMVEIMRAWPYRRPSPVNFLVAADFAKVWHAEVLTGLPLSAEVEERKA